LEGTTARQEVQNVLLALYYRVAVINIKIFRNKNISSYERRYLV
jgi:hypothetical protein